MPDPNPNDTDSAHYSVTLTSQASEIAAVNSYDSEEDEVRMKEATNKQITKRIDRQMKRPAGETDIEETDKEVEVSMKKWTK